MITHAKPDGDAIAAAWLAERFLFNGEAVEILFLERERVLGAYREGDCLVDVGNTHEPERFFFDHKKPAFPSRHDSCAAKLVWEHLRALGRRVEHLEPLVRAAFAGDSARARAQYSSDYMQSNRDGFHAAIARARESQRSDADVYREVRGWLDRTYRVPRKIG